MVKEKIEIFYKHNKKLLITIIALLEAIMIISAATFSWIEGTKDGKVRDSESSTVSAGAGLMFKDIDGKAINKITLPDVNLEDCSSVDGRNFFFPTTESNGTETDNYKFRAGTDADKNTKYISKDFNIESLATSRIFVGIRSKVTCEGDNQSILNAIRISLNFNDGTDPVVFCPALRSNEYEENNYAVSSIDTSGKATTQKVSANAFNKYWFNTDNPIATIEGGDTKRVTFTMWLEGTDENCIVKNIPSKSIDVDLILSTTENPTKQITFVDYSPNNWINDIPKGSSKPINMYAIDKNTISGNDFKTGDYYYMEPQDDGITYIATVPGDVTNIMFARFDPFDQSIQYNTWADSANINMGSSTTYYAIGRGKDVDKVNYGYWVQSSCAEIIDIELTETPLKNEIKFTLPSEWSESNGVKAYFFNNSNTTVGNAWPGTSEIGKYKNSLNQTYYVFTIPDGATKVVFNDNDKGKQTVDITLTEESGYYWSNTMKDGKYEVKGWGVERIDTSQKIFRSDYNPNIYFQSATYGSALNISGGVFNPTAGFNQSSNYGFNMHSTGTNSNGEYVYHMYLPADSKIIFNGYGNKSETIDLSTLSRSSQKVGFRFYSASQYKTY